MLRNQRHGSWNAASQDELKVGRHTVRLKRSLGEGGFAFIHLVEDVNTGRVLVLKRSSLQSLAGRVVYEKEASIMRSLAHPNIVQIVTAVELQSSKTGAILMEFCPRGHLLDALNGLGGKRMPETAVLSVMCDIVSAVKYLHDKGITHRDVKLENILRSASGPHKLCDFGSCVQGGVPLQTAEQRANEEEVVEKTTTQMYRAPEMVDLYLERELTEKVDVWALGCVLYAVCYLKNPFQDAGNLGILNARIRIPDDSKFSVGLTDLIRRCLTPSPTHRPSASEVEGCIHALSKGSPLPPPRHRKTSEGGISPSPHPPAPAAAAATSSNMGGFRASAAPVPGAAVTRTRSGGPYDNNGGGFARNTGGGGVAGRGFDGSGRSWTAAGATATAFTQQQQHQQHQHQGGSPSPKPAPTSAQLQLNPNSVAARRLASRKGSASAPQATAGGGGNSQENPPSPSREQGFPAPEVAAQPPPQNSSSASVDGQHSGRSAFAREWSGAPAAGAAAGQIGSGLHAANAGAVPGGSGVDPDPNGWSNFAAFDQFPASELSTSNGFAASFESSEAGATASPNHNSGSRGAATRESTLLDLGRSGEDPRQGSRNGSVSGGGGGGGHAVSALGQQLTGMSFPTSSSSRGQRPRSAGFTRVQNAPSRSEGGPGGGIRYDWMAAHPSGQGVLAGRAASVPTGDGFAATFPRFGAGGEPPIGNGNQQRPRDSPSPSPPRPPSRAAVAGGAVMPSAPASMAFASPSVGSGRSAPSCSNTQQQQQQQQHQAAAAAAAAAAVAAWALGARRRGVRRKRGSKQQW
ncbi:unnamed protein product [Scytosiphon promiscuus]